MDALWAAYEKRRGFIAWGPADGGFRYAVIQPAPGAGFVWVIVGLGERGGLHEYRRSMGAFYDGAEDHPEGALAWALANAAAHKAWVDEWLREWASGHAG
jgi:hypothetical protein